MADQKGSALLMVLLMMALVMIIVVTSNDYWMQVLARSQAVAWKTQVKWVLIGNENILKERIQSGNKPTEGKLFSVSIDGFPVNYEVKDLNDCFNINALVKGINAEDVSDLEFPQTDEPPEGVEQEKSEKKDQYASSVFTNLIMNVSKEDLASAKKVTLSLESWLNGVSDGGISPEVSGESNDQDSATDGTPRLMTDRSELRLIKGITPQLWQQLKSWVCVYPEHSLSLNINLLKADKAPLLSAMFTGKVSVTHAAQLINSRPQAGWGSTESLIESLKTENLINLPKINESLALKSKYSSLNQWVEDSDKEYYLRTMIESGEGEMKVIVRRYGISEPF